VQTAGILDGTALGIMVGVAKEILSTDFALVSGSAGGVVSEQANMKMDRRRK
jgi:hypothetical protein